MHDERVLLLRLAGESGVSPTLPSFFSSNKETFSSGVEIGNSDPNSFVELAERITEPFSKVAYDSWNPSYGLSKCAAQHELVTVRDERAFQRQKLLL